MPIPPDAFEQAADVLARGPWCPDCGLRLQVEQPSSDRLHPPRRGPDGEALYPVLTRCPRNAERPATPFEPAFVVVGVRYQPVCDYGQVTPRQSEKPMCSPGMCSPGMCPPAPIIPARARVESMGDASSFGQASI